MADNFDPYYEWLGIPPEEQPADHYRLLGVKRFEGSDAAISNAADQRTHFLRTFKNGERVAIAQRLLNEVASARVALLDPARRAKYDAELKARDAAKPAARPLPKAAPLSAPVAAKPPAAKPPAAKPPAARPPVSAAQPAATPQPEPASTPAPLFSPTPTAKKESKPVPKSKFPVAPIAIAAVAGIVVLGIVVVAIMNSGGGNTVAQGEGSPAKKPKSNKKNDAEPSQSSTPRGVVPSTPDTTEKNPPTEKSTSSNPTRSTTETPKPQSPHRNPWWNEPSIVARTSALRIPQGALVRIPDSN